MSETYDEQIAGGSDDGNCYTGSNSWTVTSQYLAVGNSQVGFFRFLNLPMSQGATIDSAILKVWTQDFGSSNAVQLKIRAIDEDNTAAFPSSNGTNTDPLNRPRTTANVTGFNFDGTRSVQRTSPDFASVVQEVVDRAGWAGGNALAIVLEDNGSTFQNDLGSYEFSTIKAAELIITYTGISTRSKQITATAVISNPLRDVGIKIMKPTYPVLYDNNPAHQIFNSDFGTLKYAVHGTLDLTVLADDSTESDSITHNLGYKPFVEVYVEDLQSPGQFYYCPGFESGASVAWATYFRITDTTLQFYVDISGFHATDWTIRFHYFIFKNDLQL